MWDGETGREKLSCIKVYVNTTTKESLLKQNQTKQKKNKIKQTQVKKPQIKK